MAEKAFSNILIFFFQICEFHKDGTTVFLDDMKVPYLYKGTFWIGFDNPESLTDKVILVVNNYYQ